MADVLRVQLNEIVTRSREAFGVPPKIVGTMSQYLAELPVYPRDIDLLLPMEIDPEKFNDQVLKRLGYSDVSEFRWVRDGVLDLSHVNHESESNPFAATPQACFGWRFPDHLWQTTCLGSEHVMHPSPELSLLLKLKSMADKIFLCTQSEANEAAFWKPLLVNDLRCLAAEIPAFQSQYRFELLWQALRCFDGPPEILHQQMQKSRVFAAEALVVERNMASKVLDFLGQLFSRVFSAEATGIVSDDDHHDSKDQSGDPVRVLVNRGTGAIRLEAADRAAIESWVPDVPFFVDVQLNATCNMTCAHCEYAMTGQKIALDLFEARIGDLASAGVLQANIGEASEALLYPFLQEALEICVHHGIVPNLSTNLSRDLGDGLKQAILDHCGTVAVSVDGFHLPKLDKKLDGHRIFARLGELSAVGQRVVINTVYEPGDLSNVASALDVAHRYGCADICVIRRFHDKARQYRYLPLSDVNDLMTLLSERRGNFGIGFHSCDPVVQFLSDTELPPRDAPLAPITEARHSVFLDSQGRYAPTSFAPSSDRLTGTIREVWTSEVFQRFRRDTVCGMEFQKVA